MPEYPKGRRPRRAYGKCTRQELRDAEVTAHEFLAENCSQISETLRAKLRFLEILIHRLSLKTTTFEDRLDYFARVSEIAALIQDDADGFFELASEPMVARILGTVTRKT